MSPPKQRSIITPEHFTVAPGILGLPLASPSRRALAMAIDGLLVLILVKAGAVFLGIAAATMLFRASRPDAASGFIRRSVRTGLRLTGAVLIFVVVLNIWGKARARLQQRDAQTRAPAAETVAVEEGSNLDISAAQLIAWGPSLLALRKAEDSASVANSAAEVLRGVQLGGASDEELYALRNELIDLMGPRADASEIAAVDDALRFVAGTPPEPVDTDPLLRGFLAARERGDSTTAAAYHDSVKLALAGGEIARLESRVHRLSARGDSLGRELAEARQARGLRLILAGFADDLGVGFGWAAVYFTAFLSLWRGQTPGKRIAGIRVLRLDGKPLGWWMSFERFGGYAASFSVGLIGFFQILWDRNRQGLHDKACETVVVRDTPQARARA